MFPYHPWLKEKYEVIIRNDWRARRLRFRISLFPKRKWTQNESENISKSQIKWLWLNTSGNHFGGLPICWRNSNKKYQSQPFKESVNLLLLLAIFLLSYSSDPRKCSLLDRKFPPRKKYKSVSIFGSGFDCSCDSIAIWRLPTAIFSRQICVRVIIVILKSP